MNIGTLSGLFASIVIIVAVGLCIHDDNLRRQNSKFKSFTMKVDRILSNGWYYTVYAEDPETHNVSVVVLDGTGYYSGRHSTVINNIIADAPANERMWVEAKKIEGDEWGAHYIVHLHSVKDIGGGLQPSAGKGDQPKPIGVIE